MAYLFIVSRKQLTKKLCKLDTVKSGVQKRESSIVEESELWLRFKP